MTFKQAVTKSGLTKEEIDHLQNSAYATWQTIGGDILTCTGQSSIPRNDVLDCVIDYLHQYVTLPSVREFIRTVRDYSIVRTLILPKFPYSHYGW